jgi:hypothetical protein
MLHLSIVAQSRFPPFHRVPQAHNMSLPVSPSLFRRCLGMKPLTVQFGQVVHAPILRNNLESLRAGGICHKDMVRHLHPAASGPPKRPGTQTGQ